MPIILNHLRNWAKQLKRDVTALWIAAHDRRTPILPRLTAAMVAAYALSPIDLGPDFIPVRGYVDDLVIVPLGIMLAIRLIPAPLMAEFRVQALQQSQRPRSNAGIALIVFLWFAATAGLWFWLRPSS